MKKIAILTQPLKSNYGGMLQAFALQSTLKSLGHDVVTIDRQLNRKSVHRRVLSFCKYVLLRATSRNKPVRFNFTQQRKIFKNTNAFIAEHISLTERIDSNKKMMRFFSSHSYDAIIVGSDQTWRPSYSPNIYNFFLDFLEDSKTKRIAYATSFGVDEWEYTKSQTAKCRELAKQFNAISTRERSGIFLCSQHLNTDAEFVLDPTLLLGTHDYIRLLKIEPKTPKTPKIFTYILDSNNDKSSTISYVSKLLNLTTTSNQPTAALSKGGSALLEDYTFPKVESWVQAINDAEFVITDSFHGCVFSIIFNKPFIAIGNPDRGQARFDSLLKLFKLEGRLITNSDQVTEQMIHEKIDWCSINSIIEHQKSTSIEFLKNNLA